MTSGLLRFTHQSAQLMDFAEHVLPAVHNAPPNVIVHYVRWAAREFCQRTHILTDVARIDVQGGVGDYTIPVMNSQVGILAVRDVVFCGSRLKRLEGPPLDVGSSERGYWYDPPGWLFVRPSTSSDVAQGLVVSVSLQPSQGCETVPSRLYTDFAEVIANGALHKLLLMKTAEWYDPQAAGIHHKQWLKGLRDAHILLTRGNSTEPFMAQATRWV